MIIIICDALHDLVPFVQFKKREKHPWRSCSPPPWVFFTFLKLYKRYQIAQRTAFVTAFVNNGVIKNIQISMKNGMNSYSESSSSDILDMINIHDCF